jgi:hypothetical protein
VAAVAVRLSVDNEAAKSHQAASLVVFPFEIQGDRRNFVTDANELIFVTASIVLRLHGVYHSRERNRSQGCNCSARPFDNEACLHAGSPLG